MFRIWCEVWGGVTGERATWLKHNDTIAEYARREDAEKEAAWMMDDRNDKPWRANYRYSVREI